MKKHDEGYVLPLVLVVMIVMCLVATSLMSFSLQNLKSQQASIDRMAEKYEAEGVIEIIEAKLSKLSDVSSADDIESSIPSVQGYTIAKNIIGGESYTVELAVQRSDDPKIAIECKMILEMDGKNVESVTYASYEISNTGGNTT